LTAGHYLQAKQVKTPQSGAQRLDDDENYLRAGANVENKLNLAEAVPASSPNHRPSRSGSSHFGHIPSNSQGSYLSLLASCPLFPHWDINKAQWPRRLLSLLVESWSPDFGLAVMAGPRISSHVNLPSTSLDVLIVAPSSLLV